MEQAEYFPPVCSVNGVQNRILVISGLPGSGKTEIAKSIAAQLSAVHVNADYIRITINRGLGFSHEDRIKQAQTLGHIAALVADAGQRAVVDFVAPTMEAREAFLNSLPYHSRNVIWAEVTRPSLVCRFEDTAKLYQPMSAKQPYGLRAYIDLQNNEESINSLATKVLDVFCPDLDELILAAVIDVKNKLSKVAGTENSYIYHVMLDCQLPGAGALRVLFKHRFGGFIPSMSSDFWPTRWLKKQNIPEADLTDQNVLDYEHRWLESVHAEFLEKVLVKQREREKREKALYKRQEKMFAGFLPSLHTNDTP